MRSRRRFHGYCPPTARKVSDVAVVNDDDYTCAMSALTMRIDFKKAKQVNGGPLLSFDYDEDSFDSCEVDTRQIIKFPTLPLQEVMKAAPQEDGVLIISSASDTSDVSVGIRSKAKVVPVVEMKRQVSSIDDVQSVSDASISVQEENESIDELFERKEATSVFEDRTATAVAAPDDPKDSPPSKTSFLAFRVNYIIVTVAIMLADGLQGTHLYVLYEGYGYSVASLYCLGFLTGAFTSPITGPLVDRIGRKKAALIYCALEIWINMLEQYPFLVGLIASRMVGGITTNLLSSVFETWLDTEYRKRGFNKEEYELVMRDSVVVSNLAAIASGYLAHELAERMGPVGPFQGAVTCTAVALAVVAAVWTENYGSEDPEEKSVISYLSDAVQTFKSDYKVLRVGIIQGLTTSSIQVFIFLWSPVVREFAQAAPSGALGLDKAGEPAYGLIFGAFMACGVLGGLISPFVRSGFTALLAPLAKDEKPVKVDDEEEEVRPMAVEFLAAMSYIVCAGLLLTPCLVNADSNTAFSTTLVAFLVYELMIGVYMPCEGVIRSIYIPSDARCSLMTLPRLIVNVCVSLGVISTRFVSLSMAHAVISCFMVVAAVIQLSLISSKDWESLSGKTERLQKRLSRSLSLRSSFAEDKKEK